MAITIFDIAERLKETFDTPEAAHEWLVSPHPFLGNELPVDLIRKNQSHRILNALEALDYGIMV
ncbi:MAG TPA: MbcA/ParS/Xre antitoxin family protein [Ktedonobacteraceae bacterium]|nr:MbcA/ParS/Xre antitoxin family protein [Ktedonobacteraceae bacterium]